MITHPVQESYEGLPLRSLAKEDATTPATFTYILGGNYSAYVPEFEPSHPAWLQGITGFLKDNGQFAIFTPTEGGVELAGYGISFNGVVVLDKNHQLKSKFGVTIVDVDHKYYDKNNAKVLDQRQPKVNHVGTVPTVTTIAQANTYIQVLATRLDLALTRLEAHGLISQ